jgi:hypothetical protein
MMVKTTIGWPMAINKRVLSENYRGRNNMWPIHTHTKSVSMATHTYIQLGIWRLCLMQW